MSDTNWAGPGPWPPHGKPQGRLPTSIKIKNTDTSQRPLLSGTMAKTQEGGGFKY